MSKNAPPKADVPESTPENEAEYEAWLEGHPGGITGEGFGSVPQERILRQRQRAKRQGLP